MSIRTPIFFTQICERLLPFAVLTHCFLSSVRFFTSPVTRMDSLNLVVIYCILAGQQSPHWQLHVRRPSLKRENVLTILFSFISLFFCASVTDQRCSNDCWLSQLLFGVFICKFRSVPLFQRDAFALTHLRTGLLISLYILNSFSEQNGSTKRYQKFFNMSQLQYSLFLYFMFRHTQFLQK